MLKAIIVAAALVSAPVAAFAQDDVKTVEALINMVAAEQLCGFPMPRDLVEALVHGMDANNLVIEGRNLGEAVRAAGERTAYNIASEGDPVAFCNGMARAYAQVKR